VSSFSPFSSSLARALLCKSKLLVYWTKRSSHVLSCFLGLSVLYIGSMAVAAAVVCGFEARAARRRGTHPLNTRYQYSDTNTPATAFALTATCLLRSGQSCSGRCSCWQALSGDSLLCLSSSCTVLHCCWAEARCCFCSCAFRSARTRFLFTNCRLLYCRNYLSGVNLPPAAGRPVRPCLTGL